MDDPAKVTTSTGTQLSSPLVTNPDGEQKKEKWHDWKYMYKQIESIKAEDIESYRDGGFHPVKLGDRLHSDFEVVAKLGNGGFGTVWLCEEGYAYEGNTNWKAVKVIAASESNEDNPELKTIRELQDQGVTRAQWETAGIMLPSRHFWIEGPNGRHLCLVFPVMGPNLRSQLEASSETIKDILAQAGRSLQFLHRHGICHGDFRTDNILLHVNDVEKLSRKEMMTLLEAPRTEQVKLADGTDLNPAPDETATIDFGISYRTGDPPGFVGIPAQWAAPEAFFSTGNTGEGSDVWSFIAMIQEIRPRDSPGAPAPSYRREWKRDLANEGVIDANLDDDSNDGDVLQPVSETAAELEERRQSMIRLAGYADYLQTLIGVDRGHMQYQRDVDYVPSPTFVPWRVPEEEVYQLADLFGKVLRYDPGERISIDEVMQHEWFKTVAEKGKKGGTVPNSPSSNNASPPKGAKGESSASHGKSNPKPNDPSKETPVSAPESNAAVHNHHHLSAGQQALDYCIHLMVYLILLGAIAIVMLPILLPITMPAPPPPPLPSSSAHAHPASHFSNIVAIRQFWCATHGGCGSDNITAAVPIPWFQTRSVSPHSVFYEGIYETTSAHGSSRQIGSGVGEGKKRFEGLLVIPSV
ncbi:kinase-like protein [Apiospora kogelbergensis]|uniref:kinase-like protein n=1 Tax=Apiospora kogelbergensis TaxID=1337665 RepID=UPI0031311C98